MSLFQRLQNAVKAFNTSEKSVNLNQGIWNQNYSLSSGFTTSNRDIADTLGGYATAYLYIWYIRACVDLYASMSQSVPSQLIYNDKPQRDNDKIIASSDDTKPSHIWYKNEITHRQKYGQAFTPSMVYQLMLYDMAFIEKMDNQFGYPSGARVLNTLGMSINRNYGLDSHDNPIRSYTYSWYEENVTFSSDEIAYTHGFNPYDDLIGSSIIQSVIDKLNVDRNLDRFLRSFFVNDARPALVGSPHPELMKQTMLGSLSQEQVLTLRKILDDNHKGVDNFWRPLITNIPINWQQLDPPQIQQFTELQDNVQKQVLAAFGVNPALVGMTEKTNYKEGLEIRAQFIQDRLKPVNC